MTQRRYDNFADDLTAYDSNQSRSMLFDPAVLSGGVFSVLSNKLYMSAINVILPSGVIISEDTSQSIDLDSVPGSSSITYTIAYTHDDQNIIHGTAAAITVYSGLIQQSSLTNGTILGWVNYPGGSVPLSVNHVIQNRSGKVSVNVSKNDIVNLGVTLPPFSNKFLSYSSSGSTISITDVCDISNPSLIQSYVEFYNPSASLSGNVIKVLPFMVGNYKPSLISLELYADLDADVTVTVIDSTGVEISPVNNTITNTNSFITRDLSWLPDYSLFAERSVFLVKLNITLDPLRKIRFKSIGYSTYNLPF